MTSSCLQKATQPPRGQSQTSITAVGLQAIGENLVKANVAGQDLAIANPGGGSQQLWVTHNQFGC
jgi:hypothetical protein